jgi:polysaccharide biosynthesis PFTS motif protein
MDQVVKAYWKCINEGDPYYIAKLNKKLSKCKLDTGEKNLDSLYLRDLQNLDLSLRQYLVSKLIGLFNSNRVFIKNYANKKNICLPFPQVWRSLLKEDNIFFNRFISELLFKLFLLKNIFKGITEILKLSFTEGYKNINQYSTCLFGINKYCLPETKIGKNYDFVSWLESEYKNKKRKYYHFVNDYTDTEGRIIFLESEYPAYKNLYNRIYFILWGISSIIFVLFLLLLGYWKTPALFYELVKRKRYQVGDTSLFFNEYVFTVSTWIYRPIWTEVLEKYNSKLRYINYSTGYPHFKTKIGYTPDEIEYELMSWPEFHNSPGKFNEYVENICSESVKITSTTPIWWNDCDHKLPNWDNKIIALYDVFPLSEEYLPDYVPYPFYRSYVNGVKFLLDVLEVAEKYGYKIAYKNKRRFNYTHDKNFIDFLKVYSSNLNIITIPPEVSPFRLSAITDATISIPFTTTAHIANYINKPSIYYDPSGTIFPDDRAAESIKLITNIDDLAYWIKSI